MFSRSTFVMLGGTLLGLLLLVFLGVRNYDYNVSALLHMDVPFGELHHVPSGVVLYQDAAYDGMLYYQIARDIPALFTDHQTSFDSPYRFQRILLPLIAYVGVLGNDQGLPYSLLITNLLAALGTLALMLTMVRGKPLHAITVITNPAMLVGIVFSLTEPVSTFFMVLFFVLWKKNQHRLNVATLLCIMLSLLARETTVFLIGLLFLWALLHKEWKQALLSLVPIPFFILWQYFLVLRFGSVPFQANSNITSIPFGGPITIIQWSFDHLNSYLLSSLGLLCFVIPLFLYLCREWIQKRGRVDLFCFFLSGLVATILSMDAHMWGAITSIGRVVTPLYPVYTLYAADRDTPVLRIISAILITVSIVAAVGIVLAKHPFVLSQ